MAGLVKAAALVAALGGRVAIAHPCETEIAAACPETPASEIAKCLKNPDEHETKTTVSSECTDFMALNTACTEDITKYCDENFYHGDTILCLTQWTDKENISPKCASVMDWAIPAADEETEGVTDELGMTQKDIDDKEEWRAKRKASRGDAIERMKMKEVDRKKEEDRLALEKFKTDDPEGYEQMIQQQAEDKKQEANFKKMERQRAAALERKKKKDQGVDEEADEKKKEQKSSTSTKKKSSAAYPWYVPYAALLALGAAAWGAFLMTNGGKGGKSSGGGGGKGKKRR